MTYQERTAKIGALLGETILPRFSRPNHFDDATARRELADMVSDLNAAWPDVPDAQFDEIGQRLIQHIRKTVDGRTWPTIARMLKCLEAVVGETRSQPGRRSDDWKIDRYENAASRIKAREGVSQDYVYGCDAVELVRRGLVTEAELDTYRKSLALSLRLTYGTQLGAKYEAQLRADHALAKKAVRTATPQGGRAKDAELAMAGWTPPVWD